MISEAQKEQTEEELAEARFSTQRFLTYIIFVLFTGVVALVLTGEDQTERSMILQTVINITLIGIGYWLGSSKPTSPGKG